MRRAAPAALVATLLLCVSSAQAGGIIGPVSIANGFGSVWVGTGMGEIVRLDERTGRETARIAGSPTEFVHGLSAAHGAVWALRSRLTRIDPRTLRTRDARGVGSATAFTIASGAGSLWVVDDGANAVTRIDPKRLRATATVRVPGRAFGLAAGGRHVFVVSVPKEGPVTGPGGRRLLRRIDPADNRLSKPLVELDCDQALAVGRSALWTLDLCTNRLVRRALPDLHPTGAVTIPNGSGLALGFGSVWVAGGNRLFRVEAETVRVTASIRVRGTQAAVGRAAVWVLSIGNGIQGFVTKVDPRTNRAAAPIPVSP
jgi:hypothetical protein